MLSEKPREGTTLLVVRRLEAAGSQLKAKIARSVSRKCSCPRRRQASWFFAGPVATTFMPTAYDDGSKHAPMVHRGRALYVASPALGNESSSFHRLPLIPAVARHVPPGGRILVASRPSSESAYLNLLRPSPYH
mmetsp:Transcript_69343/g.162318  ORF Transcript_69343/g.162318 Transcript_69343/m.162318 type:complete len:134 (+) Transcript_69343:1773-2174(+)